MKTKHIFMALAMISLIVIVSFVSSAGGSSLCYQETANVSTVCGGLDTGVYSWVGTGWKSESNMTDGDFNSGTGTIPESGQSYLYINYTIPNNALNSSLWKLKNLGIEGNYSIPSTCWDYGDSKLVYRINAGHGDSPASTIAMDCFNTTDWIEIDSHTEDVNTFYEEAMWWNITDSSIPSVKISFGSNNHFKLNSANSRLTIKD